MTVPNKAACLPAPSPHHVCDPSPLAARYASGRAASYGFVRRLHHEPCSEDHRARHGTRSDDLYLIFTDLQRKEQYELTRATSASSSSSSLGGASPSFTAKPSFSVDTYFTASRESSQIRARVKSRAEWQKRHHGMQHGGVEHDANSAQRQRWE